MAEETLNSPDKHVLEDNSDSSFPSPINRRLSVGSHYFGSSPRRNSMAKSDSGSKPVPNYMRASIGSCHDICKYGKKQTFEILEEKPWKAIKKRTSSTASSHKNMDFLHIKVPVERNKEQLAKAFSDAKTYSPRQIAPSSNKTRPVCNLKKSPSPEPPEVIKEVIMLPSPKMEKRESSVGVKVAKNEEKMDHGLNKRSPKKSTHDDKMLPSPKMEKRESSVGVKVSKTDEKMDHGVNKRSPKKSPNNDKMDCSCSPMKPKLPKVKQSPSSVKSDGVRGKGERIRNHKSERRKVLVPSASASSSKLRLTRTMSIERKKTGTLKVASLMKDHNKTRMAGAKESNNEKVSEITLQMDKEETGLLSKTTPHEKDAELKEKHKMDPKNRVVSVKLQFRSGKVIELCSDTNAPKRLKFKKAKSAEGEKGKGDVTENTFDNADVLSVSRKLVKGKKKKAQVLLNNVIEETASKLEEIRKGKVKALVGAFETVISLQEVTSSLNCESDR